MAEAGCRLHADFWVDTGLRVRAGRNVQALPIAEASLKVKLVSAGFKAALLFWPVFGFKAVEKVKLVSRLD